VIKITTFGREIRVCLMMGMPVRLYSGIRGSNCSSVYIYLQVRSELINRDGSARNMLNAVQCNQPEEEPQEDSLLLEGLDEELEGEEELEESDEPEELEEPDEE
jgi:hypothetical protein